MALTATIRGSGMGVLCANGATPRQIPLLARMGVGTGAARTDRQVGEPLHPLEIDGSPFEFARDRVELETRLLSGLMRTDGGNDADIDDLLRRLHPSERPAVGAVERDLIEHLGLSPAWVELLAATLHEVDIGVEGRDDGAPILGLARAGMSNGRARIQIRIGGRAWWTGNGVRLRDDIPDAAAAAAVGRMLRDVVSHEILDRHPLRVDATTGRHIAVAT